MKLFIVFLAAIACTGCTTRLAVSKVDPANPATRVGIPFALMYTQYEIAVTRQVIGCGNELKVAIRSTIKGPTAFPDPNNLFILDHNSLSSPLKTSAVLAGFAPNGAPLTLNASAEDRTAQVIANIASTAVSIAKLALLPIPASAPSFTGSAPAAPPPPPTAPPDACSNVVLKALAAVKERAPALSAATVMVERRTDELAAIQDKLAAMGINVDETSKGALSRAVSALTAALDAQEAKKDALSIPLQEIVYSQTSSWPGNGDTGTEVKDVPAAVLQRWLSTAAREADFKELRVYFALRSLNAAGRDLTQPDVVRPELGLPFRQPVAGKLSVCREPCTANSETVATSVGDVLQLGYVYYFPCESRPFSSITCTYTMTDAGRVQSMGGSQLAATAEVFTGALKTTIDKAGEIKGIGAIAAQKRLEAETALLKAQADRDAAAAALHPSQGDPEAAASLNASTDMLNAQRARIGAEIALSGARTRTP